MKRNFYLTTIAILTVALISLSNAFAQPNAGSVVVTHFNGDSTLAAGANIADSLRQGETYNIKGTYDVTNAKSVRFSYDVYKTDWSGTAYSYQAIVADDTLGTIDGTFDFDVTIPEDAGLSADYVDEFKIIQMRVFYDPAVDTYWNFYVEMAGPAPASIGMPALESLNVYPNPVRDGFLKIETSNNKVKDVKIFDVAGRILFAKSIRGNERLDISSFEKGLYILRVEEDGRASSRKIVVE